MTGACSHSSGPRFSAWQVKQVWLSVGFFSIAALLDPCALWQSLHVMRPNRTGCDDAFWNSERCCLWQAKHTSGWVLLLCTGSRSACSLWQSVHAS